LLRVGEPIRGRLTIIDDNRSLHFKVHANCVKEILPVKSIGSSTGSILLVCGHRTKKHQPARLSGVACCRRRLDALPAATGVAAATYCNCLQKRRAQSDGTDIARPK
jgi:hypothetical protein